MVLHRMYGSLEVSSVFLQNVLVSVSKILIHIMGSIARLHKRKKFKIIFLLVLGRCPMSNLPAESMGMPSENYKVFNPVQQV